MTKLETANSAFRAGDYERALRTYLVGHRDGEIDPSIAGFNVQLAKRRLGVERSQEVVRSIYPDRVVVYSCNFGGYEDVKEPIAIDPSVRYIMFTDNPDLSSDHWEILLIEDELQSPRRTSRLPKILPHHYLPAHEISLYVDSTLVLKTKDIRQMIRSCLARGQMALYPHHARSCVYDEINYVRTITRGRGISDDQFREAIALYENISYPKKNGLFECSLIVRVDSPAVRSVNHIWWREYSKGSQRDQFTFMYALEEGGVEPTPITAGRQVRRSPYVDFVPHEYRDYAPGASSRAGA